MSSMSGAPSTLSLTSYLLHCLQQSTRPALVVSPRFKFLPFLSSEAIDTGPVSPVARELGRDLASHLDSYKYSNMQIEELRDDYCRFHDWMSRDSKLSHFATKIVKAVYSFVDAYTASLQNNAELRSEASINLKYLALKNMLELWSWTNIDHPSARPTEGSNYSILIEGLSKPEISALELALIDMHDLFRDVVRANSFTGQLSERICNLVNSEIELRVRVLDSAKTHAEVYRLQLAGYTKK